MVCTYGKNDSVDYIRVYPYRDDTRVPIYARTYTCVYVAFHYPNTGMKVKWQSIHKSIYIDGTNVCRDAAKIGEKDCEILNSNAYLRKRTISAKKNRVHSLRLFIYSHNYINNIIELADNKSDMYKKINFLNSLPNCDKL